MHDKYIETCLNCPLPFCDERHQDCLVRIARVESRRRYYAEYYKANRDRKLKAANDRHDHLRSLRTASKHKRYYWRHKSDPAWLRRQREANAKAAREYRRRTRFLIAER